MFPPCISISVELFSSTKNQYSLVKKYDFWLIFTLLLRYSVILGEVKKFKVILKARIKDNGSQRWQTGENVFGLARVWFRVFPPVYYDPNNCSIFSPVLSLTYSIFLTLFFYLSKIFRQHFFLYLSKASSQYFDFYLSEN